MLPSSPIGLSGLGVHVSWQFLGSLSGALAKGMLETPVGAAVQGCAYVFAHARRRARWSVRHGHACPRCPWRPPRRAVRTCLPCPRGGHVHRATIVAGPSLDPAPEPVRGQGLSGPRGLGEDMVGEDIVGAVLVLALAALLGEAPRSRSRQAGEEQRRKK